MIGRLFANKLYNLNDMTVVVERKMNPKVDTIGEKTIQS